MIEQYLSNKNESATVAKSEFFSELNKALVSLTLPTLFFEKKLMGLMLVLLIGASMLISHNKM